VLIANTSSPWWTRASLPRHETLKSRAGGDAGLAIQMQLMERAWHRELTALSGLHPSTLLGFVE